MHTPRTGTRAIVLALLAGTALPATAHATVLNWASAVSGNAANAASWSPAQAPTAADTLAFNVTAGTQSYTVTFGAGATQSALLSVSEDVVSFNITSSHTTGALRIGNDATPNPTCVLTGGTLTCSSGGVFVGNTVNAVNATLQVNDFDAFLRTSGVADIFVGSAGQGVLNVTGGGTVDSSDDIIIGNLAGSDGLATLSGSLTFPTTFHIAHFDASSGGGDIIVGDSGTGGLNISSLAEATAGHDVVVGQSAGSVGSVQVFNGGQLHVGHDLLVGGNTSGAGAGNGTLETLPSGATISVTGATIVGDANAGTGVLRLNGGTLTTGSFALVGGGTLLHDDGTLVVDGGTFSNNSTSLFINSATGTPVLDLRGAQTNAFTAGTSSIVAGDTARGTLFLRNGRTLSGSNGSVEAGRVAGSVGEINVESGATLNTGNAAFFVGNSGSGTLRVTAGGHVNASNTIVAGNAVGTGAVTVSGAGSTLNALDIVLGGNQNTNANFGPASLTISDGAVVTASDDVFTFGGDDTLTITNATLNAQSIQLRTSGVPATLATLTNATVHADLFEFTNGDATLSGLVDAAFRNQSAVSTMTLNGDLTAGDAAATAGFIASGTLNVGTFNLVMLDSNGATLGTVINLSGGSMRCDTGMVHSLASHLNGFGTIHSNFTNGGFISPSGTGLTFNGILTGVGNGISGTRMTFGASGGFTGSGTIDAEVFSNAGSVITATGPLTLGPASSASGIDLSGLLIVGSQSVTLRDTSTTLVGDVVMNAGFLNCTASNLFVRATCSGSGTITSPVFFNRFAGSRLEPNGTISVVGGYSQAFGSPSGPGGTLEINATSVAGFDRLAVSGTATLAGTLEASLVPGGSLSVGDRITFLTCVTRSGTFQSTNTPGFHVEYFSNHVDLVFDGLPCDPDTTQDGNADQDDVSYLINVIGGGENATGIDPDFNHDGNTDQDDVSTLIDIIAGGPCP